MNLCELFYQVILNESTIGKKYVSLEKQKEGMHYVIKLIADRLNYSLPQKSYSKVVVRIYLKLNGIASKLFGIKKVEMRLRSLNILSNHAIYFNNAYEDIGWKQRYSLEEIVNTALDDYLKYTKYKEGEKSYDESKVTKKRWEM